MKNFEVFEKEIKELKNKYGAYAHVRLTQTQYDKLQNDFGNVDELVKHLDEYIQLTGKKYKDHNLAIRKWVVDAVNEKRNKGKKDVLPSYYQKNTELTEIDQNDLKTFEDITKEI